MGRFDGLIAEIRDFVRQQRAEGHCREFSTLSGAQWPLAGPRDLVLLPDLALELGHP